MLRQRWLRSNTSHSLSGVAPPRLRPPALGGRGTLAAGTSLRARLSTFGRPKLTSFASPRRAPPLPAIKILFPTLAPLTPFQTLKNWVMRELKPVLERWAKIPLEPSVSYGIRIYGPGEM